MMGFFVGHFGRVPMRVWIIPVTHGPLHSRVPMLSYPEDDAPEALTGENNGYQTDCPGEWTDYTVVR